MSFTRTFKKKVRKDTIFKILVYDITLQPMYLKYDALIEFKPCLQFSFLHIFFCQLLQKGF